MEHRRGAPPRLGKLAGGFARQFDRWNDELRPGAIGFLGSTEGTTEDGRFIVLARFDDEQSARRNNDRPEQGAWWADTEKYVTDVEFADSIDVISQGAGASVDAGFVQVMRGRIIDAAAFDRMQAKSDELDAVLREARPDVLGGLIVRSADGGYSNFVYFESEQAARAGETADMPAEMQAMFEEMTSAVAIDDYLDLRDPQLR